MLGTEAILQREHRFADALLAFRRDRWKAL